MYIYIEWACKSCRREIKGFFIADIYQFIETDQLILPLMSQCLHEIRPILDWEYKSLLHDYFGKQKN